MIQGDRNYLKATLTRGMLELQKRLIDLYVGNLQSIGTQAALVGAFAFAGIGEITMPTTGYTWLGLSFLYDCFIHATLCLSIWATAQATIVTMYGPAVALKGAEFDTVLYVAEKIREQRRLVLFIGAASLSCIYLATIFNFWAKIPPAVALSTTIVYTIGYTFTVVEGIRCYNVFHPDSTTVLTKISVSGMLKRSRKKKHRKKNTTASASGKGNYSQVNSGTSSVNGGQEGGELDDDSSSSSSSESEEEKEDAKTQVATLLAKVAQQKEASQVRARGMLWWRQPLSDGGQLLLRYCILQRGSLDLYKSEKEFLDDSEPINDRPFKLSQYRLEKDYSRFPQGVTSGVMAIRRAAMGQGEFSWLQLKTSPYDLKLAVNKYRFCIMPKVFSELAPLETAEFMANDEEEYKLWTQAFEQVIQACEYLEENATLEATLKGATNVELIVKAAAGNMI